MSLEQRISPQSIEERIIEFLDKLADDSEFLDRIARSELGKALHKKFSSEGNQTNSPIDANTQADIMMGLKRNRKVKTVPTKYELIMDKLLSNPNNLITVNDLKPILGDDERIENAVAARLSKLNVKLKKHSWQAEHVLAYQLTPITNTPHKQTDQNST